MVMNSLKSYLYCFSWNCVIFQYSYWSLISILFACIAWHCFHLMCYLLPYLLL